MITTAPSAARFHGCGSVLNRFTTLLQPRVPIRGGVLPMGFRAESWAEPPGVTLCNAAGLHDTSTAELAIALALGSGRHLDEFARHQSVGAWRFVFGRALADQRVLIVGYGHIGQAIERRLDGFEVASVTRVARRARTGPPEVHPVGELHRLLPEADVVFLIAPHTPQTEGLIGARELALLPDGALLVNVARGKLVDT